MRTDGTYNSPGGLAYSGALVVLLAFDQEGNEVPAPIAPRRPAQRLLRLLEQAAP